MDTRCSPNIPHRKFFECLTYVKFTFWCFIVKAISPTSPSLWKGRLDTTLHCKKQSWCSNLRPEWADEGKKRRRKHSFCSSRLFILILLLQRTFLHYNSVRTMSSFVSRHAQMICTPFIHVMLKMSLCLIWVGWKGPVTLQVWDHQTFKSSPLDPKLLVYYL
jgi:hypothetical protein